MGRTTPNLQLQRLPLNIVGSNKFGRYAKISFEKSYNFFISDGWMVPTPGHLKVLNIDPLSEGRGVFTSTRGNFMLAVIGSGVYAIRDEIQKVGRTIPVGDITEGIATLIGTLDTFSGDVFIDENDAEQIAICDKKDIYIYNYDAATFQKVTLDFLPGYVTFQDGYFIAPDLDRNQWRLSQINEGTVWPAGSQNVGELESKPDKCRACVRVPGKGNQLFVMGSTVTESWNDIGYKLFPYYRTNSFNIDYGCVNQSTIAAGDKFVIWLARNEQSAPVIMYSEGGQPRPISTDGINFALKQLEDPEDSYGFIYENEGHLFYQLTFRKDKVTYLYDFNTNKFFFLSDEKLENHIAKKVTFFANDYYFISLIDGNIYRLSSDFTTADGGHVPRLRITNTVRLPDSDLFIGKRMGFTIEQGDSKNLNRIDLSISNNGGITFGNFVKHDIQALPNRENKFTEYDFGISNEMTFQLRFWGDGRFLCKDGYVDVAKKAS